MGDFKEKREMLGGCKYKFNDLFPLALAATFVNFFSSVNNRFYSVDQPLKCPQTRL